ncbi:PadR family transcriptional regulator [Hoyosella rhizosphaerae]|uniref:PadR family transcriptional regulator n=1 Tax=Hoyosella rhizosphaerae TaxID=1755582 RepID=A0A916X9P7_9ACTN|nr:PadR family transcriptional regulator [Hoyosella rhizosphaerae]MBN4926971.1 PadR family transcriptional regulator [Hoyosella rhizosphaerae]GGC55045.1 PadR family transcriptional regulator [Hoyosella rhizosphaerae]
MTLRHAVLAALLDGDMSGYQLAKTFDVSVSNYWHALPQQLYGELTKLEKEGLITGRVVIQQGRPNKRLFSLADPGTETLTQFITEPSRPSFIRDDLLVKVRACEVGGHAELIEQLEERAVQARAKITLFDKLLRELRGGTDEETYLASNSRIGPYLTGLRGRAFETETLLWCEQSARVLRLRIGSKPANG